MHWWQLCTLGVPWPSVSPAGHWGAAARPLLRDCEECTNHVTKLTIQARHCNEICNLSQAGGGILPPLGPRAACNHISEAGI